MGKCVLLQDNAKPHVSKHTTAFLRNKHCNLIRQPVYSPDTNICDRMVFPKAEMKRSKIEFAEKEDLEKFLHQELSTLTPDIMRHEMDMLLIHLRNVINNNGKYVL